MRGLTFFVIFTLICVLIGSAQMMLAAGLYFLHFRRFAVDEWFTTVFTLLAGFVVFIVGVYGLVTTNIRKDRAKAFKKFSYFLLIPFMCQFIAALVDSLPLVYKQEHALPAYIPGSQIHRPTRERLVYYKLLYTLAIIALAHMAVLVIHWYFTLCYSNSPEIDEDEMDIIVERGRFAAFKK